MARRGASPTPRSGPVAGQPGEPGSARTRLRRAAVVVMTLVAATWAIIGVRLYFLPPEGLASSLGAFVGLVAAANAVAYEFAAYWVGVQKRWGHIAAIVLLALNVLLGFTAQMTWLEWALLGVNVVTLGMLIATVPRRR